MGVRDHKFVVHAITIPLALTHYAHPFRVRGSLGSFIPGPHGMQRRPQLCAARVPNAPAAVLASISDDSRSQSARMQLCLALSPSATIEDGSSRACSLRAPISSNSHLAAPCP